MRRWEAKGLRPGWRGAVAYLCSPWLWRGAAFVVLLVAVLAFAANLVRSGIDAKTTATGQIVGGLSALFIAVALLWVTAYRWIAQRRQAALSHGDHLPGSA
ncbi:MAG TPA: hypothetical protein VGM93_05035 [Acidimicrobiales bacterium]